jgi:putative transposase
MKQMGLPWSYHHLNRFRGAEGLSSKEKEKLKVLEIWHHTKDLELVCGTFGVSRATVYRWIRRFNPKDLTSLKDKSRRPKNIRKPLWSTGLIKTVKSIRMKYPRWGKEKLVILLRREGFETSASTVGRILTELKRRGALIEPVRKHISCRKRRHPRSYAVRKPKDYIVQMPGDLVELDTLDIRPIPDLVLKQFTARDCISRWDVCEVHCRATAKTATMFLDSLVHRMPFVIRAIQIDGGSEFFADFEEECKKRAIFLFVLPPKSPKLNGHVERANRTHTEEFYQVQNCSWTISELNQQLLEWEKTYNFIRPHQALGYLTPAEFIQNLNK